MSVPVKSLRLKTSTLPLRVISSPKLYPFCEVPTTHISQPFKRQYSGGRWRNASRFSLPSNKKYFHSSNRLEAQVDPYKVLGVSKSSTPADIKKAYYSLAKKYHPDTNKDASAKDKFNEAQSAYEILSDPKKKEAYDAYGSSAFDSSGNFNPGAGAGPGGNPFAGGNPFGAGNPFAGFSGGQGFNAGGINFEDLFGAFGGGATSGGRRGKRGNPFGAQAVYVGEDINVDTTISFMEAAKGTSKTINMSHLIKCGTCSGSGLKKGVSKSKCTKCDGTGTRVSFMQPGFQMATTCDACNGSGITTPKSGECRTCRGDGVTRDRKTVTVDIPGGVEDGMRLKVSGEGDMPPLGQADDPNPQGQPGDLYVHIRVTPDKNFARQGSDILYTASIPFTTAILGGDIKVPTLDGETSLHVPTGTGTGDKAKLNGMGMLKLNSRRGAKGDLRIEFKVNSPKYLSANQRTIAEMLADEMGDKFATRTMIKPKADTQAKDLSDDHQNEGFLKSAWHSLTGQHSSNEEHKTTSETTDEENHDKKKASGSG